MTAKREREQSSQDQKTAVDPERQENPAGPDHDGTDTKAVPPGDDQAVPDATGGSVAQASPGTRDNFRGNLPPE